MPATDVLEELGLTDADLQHEEREAREARRKAEAEKRTIKFGGKPLDTGGDDFAALFEQLADAALAEGPDWFARSRPPRLAIQEQAPEERRRPGPGGGKGQDWRNQPPDAVRRAMGIASEWLAREYLRRRPPPHMGELWSRRHFMNLSPYLKSRSEPSIFGQASLPVQPHMRSLPNAAAPGSRFRRVGSGGRGHSSRAAF